MAHKKHGQGQRVRAKDLFTLFTGLWGHEEFDACWHKLIKIKFGSILANYVEGEPRRKPLEAKKYGLAEDGEIKIRHMVSNNMGVSVLNFNPEGRPHLRALYKDMLIEVKAGKKKLFNGRISWNILSFVTIGPHGHKCYWERVNIGSEKDTVYVPLLVKVDQMPTTELDIKVQMDAVGIEFFGGKCNLTKKISYGIECAGM